MEDAVMMRMISKVVLLAVALSVVSANALATEPWNWWYIPQVAFGGGYTSTLIIRDSQGLPSRTVNVYLYKDTDAKALYANVSGQGNNISSFHFQLGPNEEKSFAITSTGATTAGQMQIASQGIGDLNASLRYTVADSHGIATDVIGVLPVEPNYSWTTSIQKGSSSENTGVAIANPWDDESITVNLDLYQNGVRVPGTATKTYTLNGNGYMAAFVDQIFGTALNSFSGTGTLRISSTVDAFVAMAVRADGAQYSSLPMDAGAQQWTCTASGSETVTWNWRSYNGYSFVGLEQHSWDTWGVGFRGTINLGGGNFTAEWTYKDSTDGSFGAYVFIGMIQAGNNTIKGYRLDIKVDGTVIGTVPFTATRVY
jgi:hypothetical protein